MTTNYQVGKGRISFKPQGDNEFVDLGEIDTIDAEKKMGQTIGHIAHHHTAIGHIASLLIVDDIEPRRPTDVDIVTRAYDLLQARKREAIPVTITRSQGKTTAANRIAKELEEKERKKRNLPRDKKRFKLKGCR